MCIFAANNTYFYNMARSKQHLKKSRAEEIREDVMNVLVELECPYLIERDGDICFEYRDEVFYISKNEDDDDPFITILKYDLMTIDMDDIDDTSRLYRAINSTNANGHIAVIYNNNYKKREIYVQGVTTILFASYIPNRKGYLEMMLTFFFNTKRLLKEQLLKQYDEEYPKEKMN